MHTVHSLCLKKTILLVATWKNLAVRNGEGVGGGFVDPLATSFDIFPDPSSITDTKNIQIKHLLR